MAKMRGVLDRLNPILAGQARLYKTSRSSGPKVRAWLFFAQRYAEAAKSLPWSNGEHDLVRTQLYGQAAECALKAYLTAKSLPVPRGTKGHDLTSLAELAERGGCIISELQAIALWQASSLFYKDVFSGSLFKARYPTEQPEPSSVSVASFDELSELIESVCSQSAA
jgi:HEPN domain-containing protein